MTTQQHPPLYLASTSVYRRALLQKLTTQFSCVKPEVDESPLPDETAEALVNRLTLAKAKAVAATLSAGLVIGSDQVAVFQGEILGKPHTVANAEAQLRRFSGQAVTFLTGLAVVNAATGKVQQAIEPFVVYFRELSEAEIRHYVAREQPLDCAGSFKSEGLGIALFDKLQGDDPNSLIGLPLIRLLAMLRNEGLNLLLHNDGG
ncbi:septum formation inhibitor Maf [Alishewanella sp. BS5-314]|uniref:Maf family protein n=1 Tax=Alishewanella sp. BS5-314 TaxID=2755587 RepID=UPI0021BAED3F|nr:nucleoside triphosphate pyrophosphatase [Alishewanella sp. BS5-314]MCT8126206.1 septum formation inhibitor Maf [Alishewanella sp. BS5-314]